METYEIGKPLISVLGVSKEINGKVILRDIGIDGMPFVIPDITRPGKITGQTIAVLGESGAGKSTLFRMMAGIDCPTTGSIRIPDPNNSQNYEIVEAGDIGFVQQTYPLSRNESVYKMLMDAARQGKVPKKERDTVVKKYLEMWGLKNQIRQSRNQLSGGQRQRVAIIEQILCSHHFIIFDEPFSGLDVKNVEDVKNSFKQITTTDEINTVIFSTHDIHLAVELSDTIIIIGFQKDKNGARIPGGTIIKEYNLMKMGLAWTLYGAEHRTLVEEIKNIIKDQ